MSANKQEIIKGFSALEVFFSDQIGSLRENQEITKTREITGWINALIDQIKDIKKHFAEGIPFDGEAVTQKMNQFNANCFLMIAKQENGANSSDAATRFQYQVEQGAYPLYAQILEKVRPLYDAPVQEEEQHVRPPSVDEGSVDNTTWYGSDEEEEEEEEVWYEEEPTTTAASAAYNQAQHLNQFKDLISPQLQTIQKHASEMTKNLEKIQDTKVTLLSKEAREAALLATQTFGKKLTAVQEKIAVLENTDVEVTKELINEIIDATYEFEAQYKAHHRAFERSDAFTVFEPTLIAAKRTFKEVKQLKASFINWETGQTDTKKAARDAKTAELITNASKINEPVQEGNELKAAIIALNTQLKDNRAQLENFSVETRWEPYRLVEKVQAHLDALTEAYAKGNEQDGYTHATAIGELIAEGQSHAKTKEGKAFLQALTEKADDFFHKVDVYSEALNTEFSTEIKREEALRKATKKSISDTDKLITKLIKHGAPSDLIRQAKFFRKAAEAWEQERPNATPQERRESNKRLIWAHERLNTYVKNEAAQKYIHRYGTIKSLLNTIAASINYVRELSGYEPLPLPFQRQKNALNKTEGHITGLEQEQEQADTPAQGVSVINQQTQKFRTFVNAEIERLKAIIKDTRLTQSSNVTDSKTAKSEARAKEINARNELHDLELIHHRLLGFENELRGNEAEELRAFACALAHTFYEETAHEASLEAHILPLIQAIDTHTSSLGEATHIQEGIKFETAVQEIIDQTSQEIEKLGGKEWYLFDSFKEKDIKLLKELKAVNQEARAFLAITQHAKKHGDPWIPKDGSINFGAFQKLTAQAEVLSKNTTTKKSLLATLQAFLTTAQSDLTRASAITANSRATSFRMAAAIRESEANARLPRAERESTPNPVLDIETIKKTSMQATDQAYDARLSKDLTSLKQEAKIIHDQIAALASTSWTRIPAVQREEMLAETVRYLATIEYFLSTDDKNAIHIDAITEARDQFQKACEKHPRIFERLAWRWGSPTQKAMENTFDTVDGLNNYFIELETEETDYTKAYRKQGDWALSENIKLIREKANHSEATEDFGIAIQQLNAQLKVQRAVVQKTPLSSRLQQHHLVETMQNQLDACVTAYADYVNGNEAQLEAVYKHTAALSGLLAHAQKETKNPKDRVLVEALAEHANDFFNTIDDLTADTKIPTHVRQNIYLNETVQDIVHDTRLLTKRLKEMKVEQPILNKVQAFEKAVQTWQTEHAVAITLENKNKADQKLMTAYDEFDSFIQNKEVDKRIHHDGFVKSCLGGLRAAVNCFRRLIGLDPLLTSRQAAMQDIKERVQDLKQAEERQTARAEPEDMSVGIPHERKAFGQFLKGEITQLNAVIENANNTLAIEKNSTRIRTAAQAEQNKATQKLKWLERLDTQFKLLETADERENAQAFQTAGHALANAYFRLNVADERLEAHILPLLAAIDTRSDGRGASTDIQAGKRLEETLSEMLRQVEKTHEKLTPKAKKSWLTGKSDIRAVNQKEATQNLINNIKLLQSILQTKRETARASWMPSEEELSTIKTTIASSNQMWKIDALQDIFETFKQDLGTAPEHTREIKVSVEDFRRSSDNSFGSTSSEEDDGYGF